jgi:uncharacterized protein YceK
MTPLYKLLPLALASVLVAGCGSVTPHYDARFGNSVRDAKALMTLDPDAGRKADAALGMDGRAARSTMSRYEQSYQSPPPVVNVINIGGAISGAGAGAGQ